MTLNDYFDRIICINLDRREDKWAMCQSQFEKHNITCTRFSGHDLTGDATTGNTGCVASHRGVLELICHHRWNRTLILEDDFYCRYDDMQKRFGDMIGGVPDDWDMLYLGGHYAENPQYRIGPNVIRIGHMMTTSSYAVSLKFAKLAAPNIYGSGPIDALYFKYHRENCCCIFQPRLMVQIPCFSDIQQKECGNRMCMEDSLHENTV